MKDESAAGRSADRALAVIDLLAQRGRPTAAAWIARECGIPRSSVYPILAILRDRRYAVYDDRRRTWEAGPRAQEIASEVPTLAESVRVLDAFDQRVAQLDPLELARRTGLDLARVTRTLHALEAEGLVIHSGDGRFALGLRLAGLAARIGPVDRLRTASRPVLLVLRDRTGETANLLVKDGPTALYLDQVESQLRLRHSGWVGRSVPLAGTAVGAALLGGVGAQVAISAVEIGVTAVACAIRTNVEPASVVSVTGPSARLRGSSLPRARAAVEDAARLIAAALSDTDDVTPKSDVPAGSAPHTANGDRSERPYTMSDAGVGGSHPP
jgi:DNA-binding IclR family transcriptional regulator